MLFFSHHSMLSMAHTIEYEESLVDQDSSLSVSFDNEGGNVPRRNEESASKSKRQRLKDKFEWKDKTVETH